MPRTRSRIEDSIRFSAVPNIEGSYLTTLETRWASTTDLGIGEFIWEPKIGDVVILRPNSPYYGGIAQLPPEMNGVITKINVNSLIVSWGKQSNSYRIEDLKCVNQNTKLVKCSNCKKKVSSFAKVQRKLYCYDCISKLFLRCAHDSCRTWKAKDQFKKVSLSLLCLSCVKKYATNCEQCDYLMFTSSKAKIEDVRTLCNKCAGKIYANKCYRCALYTNRTLADCVDCGDELCSDCNSTHYHRPDVDEVEYSSKTFKGEKPSKIRYSRLVGVEFEADQGKYRDIVLPKHCGIQGDGSLRMGGVEIQTPPASLSALEAFTVQVCQAFKRAGFTVSPYCGLHVHIDARDFSKKPTALARVLKTFYVAEDIIFSMHPSSRRKSKYSLPLSAHYKFKDFKTNRLKSIEERWYKDSDVKYRKEHKYDDTRYSGFNLHSFYYRKTFEFRYHSGTLNPVKVTHWINLLLGLVYYAEHNYKEAEIEALKEMPLSTKKVNLFLDTFKIAPVLRGYIKARILKFNSKFNFKSRVREND